MKRKNMMAALALAGVVMLAIGSPAFADGVQLLTNPGFEDAGGSYNGYFTFGSGVQLSTTVTDNIARTDTTAAKLFGEFSGCPIPSFNVGGFGQLFTPTVGMEYEFSGYSFVSTTDTIPGNDACLGNRAIVKVVFFNAAVGGSEISSNEYIIGDWSTPRDVWVPFTVSALAPAGALRVEALVLFLQPGCDEGSVFVDDLFFCENTPTADPNVLVNPSFSSGLTGWSIFGNAFPESRTFATRTPSGSAALFGSFVPAADCGMFQRLDTEPGKAWKLSVHSLNTCQEDAIRGTNQNIAYALIVFRDTAGNDLGGANVVIADSTSALGTWTKFDVTATAPAGTDSVDALILFTQGPLLEGGKIFVDDVAFDLDVASSVGNTPRAGGATLYQNVPNPFNPTTSISFDLTQRDNVSVSVYDVKGRLVNTLFKGSLGVGPHSVSWDGTNANGLGVASGVYLYVLRTSTGEVARRMVLLK